MKKNLALVFLAFMAFYACGVKAAKGVALSKEATKGHELYTANCGNCHALKEVKTISVQRWEEVLPGMLGEARLNESDGKLVSAYIWEELGVKGK